MKQLVNADLTPTRILQALKERRPVIVQVQQNAGTDHWFMLQPHEDGQVYLVDAWQGRHPLRNSSAHRAEQIKILLEDLLGSDSSRRNLAANSLFGQDHGFEVRARGIRAKCGYYGQQGKGLQVNPRSQRAASLDAYMIPTVNGEQMEMRLGRAFSMDDALPHGAGPFTKRPSAAHEIRVGAAFGAAFGFVCSLGFVLARPEGRTAAQKAEDILVPTALCAVEGASGVAVMRALASQGALARAAGGGGVAVVGAGLFITWDAIKLARGRCTVVELRKNAAGSLAGGAGGLGGAAAGAAVGSLVGPVGTVIGGLVGGIAGGLSAAIGGQKLDEAIWDAEEDTKEVAFEFLHYPYTRWKVPKPVRPKELQARYEKRLGENPYNEEWISRCNYNLKVALAVLWPDTQKLEEMVQEEYGKV